MSRNWVADTKNMMAIYQQETPRHPQWPEDKVVELRKDLIWEEFNEFLDAVHDRDMVEAADAIVDLLVVVIGTGLAFGLPLQALWDEVYRSNRSKAHPVFGTVQKADNGKVMKPASFSPPDIKGIIEHASMDRKAD